jgi:hypothetical protein
MQQSIDSNPETASRLPECFPIDDLCMQESRPGYPYRSTETVSTDRKLWSGVRPLPRRPPRYDLERACRIALMEGEGPVSVEVIYERVLRRGSLTFYGYRRPFRAITVVMTSLTRRNEVAVELKPTEGNTSGRRHKRLWTRVVLKTT